MVTEKLKLKPEQIMTAIAEACGGCTCNKEKHGFVWHLPDCPCAKVYPNDLDAMQLAWRWMCDDSHFEDDLEAECVRTAYGDLLEATAVEKAKRLGGSPLYHLANLEADEKSICFCKAVPCKCGCKQTLWECPRWKTNNKNDKNNTK